MTRCGGGAGQGHSALRRRTYLGCLFARSHIVLMASPFALPASERQAFFTLLDEYFSSRPHVLDHFQTPLAPSVTAAPTVSTTSDTPLAGKKAAPPPPPRRSNSTMSSASTPAPPYSPPVDHLASEMEDKAHVSSVHHGIRKPAGLTTTKVRCDRSLTHESLLDFWILHRKGLLYVP